ncbi:MAG TPA: radical SAM protein [Elusimicrobiales bacterium]|nr:radical SAM protein [Elusimicrobiales bacterium]
MTDKYGIDSHKLNYHLGRVCAWQAGENIYPIYAEFSPSGACNHRCVYCGLDFMQYKPRFHDAAIITKRIAEMGRLGLKSIMFAGEGEPFLHPEMPRIANAAKAAGVDVAFTTNAVLFTPDKCDACLKSITWLKVSINAGTPETYAKIHGARAEDFNRVFENMAYAVRLKKKKKLSCALGMQLVLLPENRREVGLLAAKAKKIGLDYLVVKPYSQHPKSKTKIYSGVKYSGGEQLAGSLEKYNGGGFSVIVRLNTMKKWDQADKGYKRCLALPFWTYVDSAADVWGCSMFLGDDKFRYGNLYKNTFREIWEGSRRKKSLAYVGNRLDASHCRVNCRMDEINRYLWRLQTPPEHVNFI